MTASFSSDWHTTLRNPNDRFGFIDIQEGELSNNDAEVDIPEGVFDNVDLEDIPEDPNK